MQEQEYFFFFIKRLTKKTKNQTVYGLSSNIESHILCYSDIIKSESEEKTFYKISLFILFMKNGVIRIM